MRYFSFKTIVLLKPEPTNCKARKKTTVPSWPKQTQAMLQFRNLAHELASFVRRRLSFITSTPLSLLCLLIVDELSHKFFLSFFDIQPS